MTSVIFHNAKVLFIIDLEIIVAKLMIKYKTRLLLLSTATICIPQEPFSRDSPCKYNYRSLVIKMKLHPLSVSSDSAMIYACFDRNRKRESNDVTLIPKYLRSGDRPSDFIIKKSRERRL